MSCLAILRMCIVLAACHASNAAYAGMITTVLYDGSLGTLPSAQGWVYQTLKIVAPPVQSIENSNGTSVVKLDTTQSLFERAGYGRQDHTLDADLGYTVRIDIRIASETHNDDDRAGVSLLVLSEDPTKALELSFWENEVWVQDDNDVPALLFVNSHDPNENFAMDTTTSIVTYKLSVLGDSYELKADGALIITGLMRDYTAFTDTLNPYTQSSSIGISDNTTSAQGIVEIARVELTQTTIPEPGALALLSVGILLILRQGHTIRR